MKLSLKAVNLYVIGKLIFIFHTLDSEFCGCPVCKICIVKTRPFPEAINHSGDNASESSRGSVCKVCDRKFYVRDLFKS